MDSVSAACERRNQGAVWYHTAQYPVWVQRSLPWALAINPSSDHGVASRKLQDKKGSARVDLQPSCILSIKAAGRHHKGLKKLKKYSI